MSIFYGNERLAKATARSIAEQVNDWLLFGKDDNGGSMLTVSVIVEDYEFIVDEGVASLTVEKGGKQISYYEVGGPDEMEECLTEELEALFLEYAEFLPEAVKITISSGWY